VENIKKIRTSAKDKAIDAIVKKQAIDDEAWENEPKIGPKLKPTSIRRSL